MEQRENPEAGKAAAKALTTEATEDHREIRSPRHTNKASVILSVLCGKKFSLAGRKLKKAKKKQAAPRHPAADS
jgi:hypothetical protein